MMEPGILDTTMEEYRMLYRNKLALPFMLMMFVVLPASAGGDHDKWIDIISFSSAHQAAVGAAQTETVGAAKSLTTPPKQPARLKIKMQNVLISSYQTGASGSEEPAPAGTYRLKGLNTPIVIDNKGQIVQGRNELEAMLSQDKMNSPAKRKTGDIKMKGSKINQD